jgi:hypothetical protein
MASGGDHIFFRSSLGLPGGITLLSLFSLLINWDHFGAV